MCSGPVQGHHVIAKQTLRRRGLLEFLWDVRNRMPVCEHRHGQHTNRFRPIPRDLVPPEAVAFAEELDLSHLIDRAYPVRSLLGGGS